MSNSRRRRLHLLNGHAQEKADLVLPNGQTAREAIYPYQATAERIVGQLAALPDYSTIHAGMLEWAAKNAGTVTLSPRQQLALQIVGVVARAQELARACFERQKEIEAEGEARRPGRPAPAHHPVTNSTYPRHDHFIERCSCGRVLAQCRCIGPRKAHTVRTDPCRCSPASPAPPANVPPPKVSP